MKFSGQLLKMSTVLRQPVQYYLNLSNQLLDVNNLIGKTLSISHTGYQCVNCGLDVPIYRMGFCKKCFFESPYASETIIRPELSTAHLGIQERDLAVEEQIQLQPHIVYLAYTGDVKVGVTRETQVPTRWIDQGATFAMPIARTENRYEAGMIEVELKNHFPDKTNWRRMLQDEFESEFDLQTFQEKAQLQIPKEYQQFVIENPEVWILDFPYTAPEKIKSLNLSTSPQYTGKLSGIKGQYLAFEDGTVFNVRGYEGFVVDLDISS